MKQRNIKAALIFIGGAILLFWGYNFLKGNDIFSNEKHFYAVYSDVSGLSNADPIYINGLQAGQVSRIAFDAHDMHHVVVEMIYNKAQSIPRNSVAKIISTNLMGTKAISIQLGDAQQPLQDGDTMRTSIESSLQEQVEQTMGPLKNKTDKLLAALEAMVSDLQAVINSENTASISQSMKHLEYSLANVAKLSGHLEKIAGNERQSIETIFANVNAITTNLRNNNEHLTGILQNAHQISDSLAQANVASTMRHANKAMADLAHILAKINRGEGSMGLLLNNDSLYWELDKSANDMNELLEDIKKNPKRYLKFSVF